MYRVRKTEKSTIKEIAGGVWIDGDDFDITYPQNIGLTEKGIEILTTKNEHPSWTWAFSGTINPVPNFNLNDIYNIDGKGKSEDALLKIQRIPGLGTKLYGFMGLTREIESMDAVAAKITQAGNGKPVPGAPWDKQKRNFQKLFFEYVLSQFNFQVIADNGDDTYQVHLVAKSFYTFEHFAVSVKMADGRRNYIQKKAGSGVTYDCSSLWFVDKETETVTVNVFTLHDNHFRLLETSR